MARGSWTTRGGLLPAFGDDTTVGCYRYASRSEVRIGSACADGSSDVDDLAVHLGVRALQDAFGVEPRFIDGVYGPRTAAAGVDAQLRHGFAPDGVIGPKHVRALFQVLIHARADCFGVPRNLLVGMVGAMSGFDPSAASSDRFGLVGARITDGDLRTAFCPDAAVTLLASSMAATWRRAYSASARRTPDQAWDVAVLDWRDPDGAEQLLVTGRYPSDDAARFIERVRNFR